MCCGVLLCLIISHGISWCLIMSRNVLWFLMVSHKCHCVSWCLCCFIVSRKVWQCLMIPYCVTMSHIVLQCGMIMVSHDVSLYHIMSHASAFWALMVSHKSHILPLSRGSMPTLCSSSESDGPTYFTVRSRSHRLGSGDSFNFRRLYLIQPVRIRGISWSVAEYITTVSTDRAADIVLGFPKPPIINKKLSWGCIPTNS